MWATNKRFQSVVEVLIKAGASLDIQNQVGVVCSIGSTTTTLRCYTTLLHYAATLRCYTTFAFGAPSRLLKISNASHSSRHLCIAMRVPIYVRVRSLHLCVAGNSRLFPCVRLYALKSFESALSPFSPCYWCSTDPLP